MKQDRESILHAAPTGNQHDRGRRQPNFEAGCTHFNCPRLHQAPPRSIA